MFYPFARRRIVSYQIYIRKLLYHIIDVYNALSHYGDMIAYLDLSPLIIRKTTWRYFSIIHYPLFFFYYCFLFCSAVREEMNAIPSDARRRVEKFIFSSERLTSKSRYSLTRLFSERTVLRHVSHIVTVRAYVSFAVCISTRVRLHGVLVCEKLYSRKCVLNAIYEEGFSTLSYGFGPTRSTTRFFLFFFLSRRLSSVPHGDPFPQFNLQNKTGIVFFTCDSQTGHGYSIRKRKNRTNRPMSNQNECVGKINRLGWRAHTTWNREHIKTVNKTFNRLHTWLHVPSHI